MKSLNFLEYIICLLRFLPVQCDTSEMNTNEVPYRKGLPGYLPPRILSMLNYKRTSVLPHQKREHFLPQDQYFHLEGQQPDI